MYTDDPCAHFLQVHEDVGVDHVYIRELFRVAIKIGFEGFAIYDSLVKDKSVAFYEVLDMDFFGVGVTFEEPSGNTDVASLVLRVQDLVAEVIAHDIVVELLTSSNIECESTNFAALFPGVGDVTVILGTSRGELDDVFAF